MEYQRRFSVFVVCLAVVLAGGAWLAVRFRPGRVPPGGGPARLATGLYIWQQEWSEGVRVAMRNAQAKTDSLLPYAASVSVGVAGLKTEYFSPDWKALGASGRRVIPVIRANDKLAGWLEGAKLAPTARELAGVAGRVRERAAAAGCRLAGVQFDYDCPTARLAGYRRLMERLVKELAGLEVSITALPTWLGSRDFGALARAVPYYVLQVHGVDPPTTIDRPVVLCDYGKVEKWLARASALGAPFEVALPTYGYRVIFDREGKFRALLAEDGGQGRLAEGFQERRVMADPDALAALVRKLRKAPPRHCRGLVWFRLPVASDRMNWPWPTLAAVLAGRAPRLEVRAEVRRPEPALCEVWVKNSGERNAWDGIRIPLALDPKQVLAHDLVMGFAEDRGTLGGPAPRVGEEFMAAWYRVKAGDGATSAVALGAVEAVKAGAR